MLLFDLLQVVNYDCIRIVNHATDEIIEGKKGANPFTWFTLEQLNDLRVENVSVITNQLDNNKTYLCIEVF